MTGSASWSLQQTRSLRITRSLGQAINLLKFTNRELAAFLAFHDAANPHLSLRTAGDPPARAPRSVAPGKHGAPGDLPLDRIAGRSSGLHEHVAREIGLVLTSARERAIAGHFIHALEPTGWLDRSVEEIARDAACSAEAAQSVLTKIQQIDPPGLFARSLAECLRLQASDAGVLTDGLSCLLDNLPLLARGEFDELSALCGCDRKAIATHFATIRGFNPKPGLAFEVDEVRAPPPDLIVSLGDGSIEVDLNRSTLPTIVVDDVAGLKPADQRMFDTAKAIARAVERRNISTLQIATEIVHRQSEFLRHGPSALKPLTLREVAEATGVHESTVSRVTSGLRMDTPRGPLGLRDFFSSALPTGGDPVSAVAVQAHIRKIVGAENPARPLSDTQIARRLEEAGIQIARRTVAKYREKLGIPGAADRKKDGTGRDRHRAASGLPR